MHINKPYLQRISGIKGKWYIRILCRAPYTGDHYGGGRYNWRNWRKFMAWPLLFATSTEAQEYLEECFTFKGISGHKLSAGVCHVANLRRRN